MSTTYSNYLSTLASGDEIDSGWLDFYRVNKYQVSARSDISGMNLRIESRSDADQAVLGNNINYTGNFFLASFPPRERHMRFRWQNNTGNTASEVSLDVNPFYGTSDAISVFPISVAPVQFSQAALVQSVIRGEDHSGAFRNVKVNSSGWLEVASADIEVLRGRISSASYYNKFGANDTITINSAPEDVWMGGGLYTGFNAVSGESIEIFSSSTNDAGSLITSGTATSTSSSLLVDNSKDFIALSIAIGDVIIDDTQKLHAIVTSVATTSLGFYRLDGSNDAEATSSIISGDAYRIARATSTGAGVIKVQHLVESDYTGYYTEYVILNGTTGVTTTGSDYIRSSRARVIIVGSSGSNVGTLTARQSTTTDNVFWSISPAAGQTHVMVDTVPSDKWLYLLSLSVAMSRSSGSAGSALIALMIRRYGEAFVIQNRFQVTNSQPYSSTYTISIPPRSDWKIQVVSVSDNITEVTGEASGRIVTIS